MKFQIADYKVYQEYRKVFEETRAKQVLAREFPNIYGRKETKIVSAKGADLGTYPSRRSARKARREPDASMIGARLVTVHQYV